MAKKKKQPVQEPEKVNPLADDIKIVKDQNTHINNELEAIGEKTDADILPEMESIGDALLAIENVFDELQQKFTDQQEEIDKLGVEAEEIQGEVNRLEGQLEKSNCVNTMVGELKYETNNLLDAEVMYLFIQCLVEVKPTDMIDNLKTILKYKTVF